MNQLLACARLRFPGVGSSPAPCGAAYTPATKFQSQGTRTKERIHRAGIRPRSHRQRSEFQCCKRGHRCGMQPVAGGLNTMIESAADAPLYAAEIVTNGGPDVYWLVIVNEVEYWPCMTMTGVGTDTAVGLLDDIVTAAFPTG